MKPLSFKRFCEKIFDRLEVEVAGRKNEVYLKRWTIINADEFMYWARVFSDRRFAQFDEGRRQREWKRVEKQYTAASQLGCVYYVGKYFLGGASAFVAFPAQIPSHAILNICFFSD